MTALLVHTVADLRASRGTGPTALVPTMGALHAGHVALIAHARERVGRHGQVVVTVFVNPTQFGDDADFARYPRALDVDVAAAGAAGADVVLAPDVVEVYGNATGFAPDSVTVDPGPLGSVLEGASRPGHYRGVLTVVAKLLGFARPDLAVFGEKDYQQLVLVRRMVADLAQGVDIDGVPTVREPDGLAMSSRNRHLDADERRAAAAIPAALHAVADGLVDGVGPALERGRAVLDAEPLLSPDYLTVTAPDLGPAPESGPARVLVAVKAGSTRLIDNLAGTVGRP